MMETLIIILSLTALIKNNAILVMGQSEDFLENFFKKP
ncbi:MAG: hypothetical protein CM15mP81_05210 [Alphaproteobacteria bacterium]|nr:MAG: hypothetical protein CM15mP81_05210 [Alphaproteobacteria bacterium]